MRLPLPIESSKLRSTTGVKHLVNCFIEKAPAQEKGRVTLQRGPGITPWITVGTGPLRGLHEMRDLLYCVSGAQLFVIAAGGGVTTTAGTVAGTGPVKMVDNGVHLVIVSEPLAYVYTPSTGAFTQITDPDFTSRGASDATFADSYILFVEPNSGRFFGSALLDALNYNALDFATAESAPDNLRGISFDHLQPILFGQKNIELWRNAGGSGFPYVREANGVIEIGCLSKESIAKMDNSLFWVADDRTVRRLNDLTPVKISTPYVEQILETAVVRYAFSYTQEGHLFYVLTLLTQTLVFDATTGYWHDRESRNGDDTLGRWRVAAYEHFNGKHVVADSESNQLGLLSMTQTQDLGNTLRVEWTYPPIYTQGMFAFHHSLEVGMDTGTGGQIMLEYSDDGGKTWEFFETLSLGALGEYDAQVVWYQLGSTMAKARVYRCAVSDAVSIALYDTQVNVEGGRA